MHPDGMLEGFELFAGKQSWSVPFRERGHHIYTTDIEDFEGIDLVADFLNTKPEDFLAFTDGRRPDFIFASPPCEGFSIAGIRFHFNRTVDPLGNAEWEPISETAKLGIALIKHLLYIIEELNPRYFFIENPRGALRKMPFMQHLERKTVTYCSYGDHRFKPTDIFGKHPASWRSRNMAKVGRGEPWIDEEGVHWVLKADGTPSHHYAPRGWKEGGTQGTKGYWERSHIPPDLAREICSAIEDPDGGVATWL